MSDQIHSAAAMMVRDYMVLAFLVSLGSLQIAVTISGIRGLWLTPNRNLTRYLGVILIIVGLFYYIFSPMWIEGPWAAGSVVDGSSGNREWGTAALGEISGTRNLNDIHGGMAGTAYAVYFVLSAVIATLFAAMIGAIIMRLYPHTDSVDSETELGGNEQAANSSSPAREGEARGEATPPDGLDAMTNSDAISTFMTSFRALRKTARDDVRHETRRAHRWSIPSVIGRAWRN